VREGQLAAAASVALLEGLIAESPRVPDYRHLLALCYRELPAPRPPAGRRADSPARDKATAILEKLVKDFPEVPDFRYDLSETYAMVDLGILRFRSGTSRTDFPQEEADSLQKALEISEALVADHPNVPNYVASQVIIRMKLGELLSFPQRAEEAEAHLRKGKALQSMLVERFPEVSSYKFGKAMVNAALAKVLRKKSLPEARALLEESVSILESILAGGGDARRAGPARGLLAFHLRSLSGVLREQGEDELAAQAKKRAEELRPDRPRRQGPEPGESDRK